jgi:tRNA (adenine57-N1/adenine58-N1)-methyltransferase
MAKRRIILRKQQRQYIPDLDKEVTIAKEIFYYLANIDQDAQTPLGMIAKKELKKKAGSIIKSNQGKEFILLEPNFMDDLKHIKRMPQTMPLKDIGLIVATTGVNKDSVVIDAGAGSGFVAGYLGYLCKKVVTYDINDKHLAVVKENMDFLGLKNVTVKKGSIYEKIPEKNANLVVLDVPEPQNALATAVNTLKIGGFVVAYCIHATQLQHFVNAVLKDKRLLLEKSSEVMERMWKVEGEMVRPKIVPLGHSGFLVFARRIC